MIHRDGLRFIAPVWSALLVWLGLYLATGYWVWLLMALLTSVPAFFLVYFFRDPERVPPEGENLIVSPADGRVILVEERDAQEGGMVVSIFMSIFDVHVNRVPVSGRVVKVSHRPGRFHRAFERAAMVENERTELCVETPHGILTFSQVAGILARRIVCDLKASEEVRLGDRFGLIRFGSRADLYLGSNTQLKVKPGDRVRAGESIIGVFTEDG